MLPRSILTLALTAFVAGASPAQTEEAKRQAARTFRDSCINCHRQPDLDFATDRAWLDQIERTA